jgi:putative DNA base modification enzyme with NMAD domain
VPQVFIVNVFANASHPFFNPLFEDGTFELIPIPERDRWKGRWIKRYRDLICFNSDKPLTRHLPRNYHKRFVHNDPDLVNMTYGNGMSPRAALLEKVAKGDWVAFYARLTPIKRGKTVKREAGFYIVAAFEVKNIIRELPHVKGTAETRRKSILKQYGRRLGHRILENAHTRHWLLSPKFSDRMRMIIVGGRRSRRFVKPIPLTRALCEGCFKDKNGKPWKWDKSKSELQTIGSYLRSIRMAEVSTKLINLFLDRERLRPPRLYSYIVATDKGFAPCVTKNLLTLACCKPKIRSTAKPGDWVMGTTPKKKRPGKLVFLARVTEKLTFAEYYNRVSKKRRDNIYRPNATGGYTQVDTQDHGPKQKTKDLSADAVLLSNEFVYYGGSAVPVRQRFASLIAVTEGHRRIKETKQISRFVEWARRKPWDVQGEPADDRPC